MSIEINEIEIHIKELTERLNEATSKINEFQTALKDLESRRFALIGAIESSTLLKNKSNVEVEGPSEVKVEKAEDGNN